MEMNNVVNNQFVEDPKAKTLYHCPRSFVIVLLVINVSTYVFGCTLIIKMITATAHPQIPDELGKMHGRLDHYENLILQLTKNISCISEQVLDMMKRDQVNQATDNAMEKKISALVNMSYEVEALHQRFHQDENRISQLFKNISNTDGQVLDVMNRTQAIEAARNILEDKMTVILNIPDEMEKMHGQLNQYGNQFSQLAENISSAEEQIIDIMIRTQTMETANNVLVENMTALLNISDEVKALHRGFQQDETLILQLVQNISGTNEQLLDIMRRIKATEVAHNASEKKMTTLMTIPEEMAKMRERFNQDENLISRLARNISSTDTQILDAVKRTQGVEAMNSALEKKMTAYLPIPDELKKIQGRLQQDEYSISQLAKNISGTDQQVSDVVKRTQVMESANNALEKKFSGYLEDNIMSKTGEFIWKFDEYESRVGKMNESKKYYNSPKFYTSQFGYKMQLSCWVNPEYVNLGITILTGEYDHLLKWPFIGDITLIIFDQSQQPENIKTNWPTDGKSEVYQQNNNGAIINTSINLTTRKKLSSRNYVKNDSLFIGAIVKSQYKSVL